jgi:subtilisin family serine protease
MSKLYSLILVVALCTAFLVGIAVADPQDSYVPGRVIVKFKPNVPLGERAAVKGDLRVTAKTDLGLIGSEVWEIGSAYTVTEAVNKYKTDPRIAYIEPDYIVHAFETPNDPRFNELWGLNNTGQTGGTADADIDAPQAWDVFTGSDQVIVVVIDTGIDYNHPDLAANVWTNPGEIPGNGIDDDGNGFIDDIHGWDFYNNDNDPFDDHGHGTHCSGTIGGVGNNGIGVAGVNWTVKIMGVKFLSSGGSGSTSGAINSINYALTIPGVKVMSNSWGGGSFSQALMDAITAAYNQGVLFVCAAGNYVGNTDVTPNYPSCYDVPNVMSIAATDHNDDLADFSGYGLVTVDLAAPGVDILSLAPGNSFATMSGTSMATPHVSGVAALVWGKYPGMTVEQVKMLIMNSVDHKASLAGKCVTGGRLNALFAISEPDTVPPGPITDLAAGSPGSNTMGLTWTAPGDDGLTGTASSYDVRYSIAAIDEDNFGSATRATGAPDPQPAGTPQAMTVRGLDFLTPYYFAMKALDEYGNAGPISNVPFAATLGAPDIDVVPTSLSEELLSGATSTQTLTVYNVAEGTLDFSIPQPTLILGTSVMKDYLALGKDEVDPRAGNPVVEGQGGPDAAGYRWLDSDEPGGPAFDWVDISSVGTAIPFAADDANLGPYPIGFTFEFYGNYFDSFRACSNGWLSFTSTLTAYSNQPLPNAGTGVPENLIAPFWDDLTLLTSGAAYYYNDGTRLIVEYVAVPHYTSGGPYTFEVMLYPNGDIVYQYLTVTDPTNSVTVGTQNDAKTDGLQVVYNADYVHDNLAVRISKLPQWVTVTPVSGTVNAGESTPLTVAFDSEGLLGGYFHANVVVNSNDPDEPTTTVPVTLHVVGAPDIAVDPTSIDFGELFVGASRTVNVVVSNPGTDNLTVSSIVSDNTDFTVNPSSFVVVPRSAQVVAVRFTPSVAEPRMGTLTITSDDPDEPTVLVSVQGTGLVPPQFSVNPTSLAANLLTNQQQSQPLTITNNGGSALNYTASVELFTGTEVQHSDGVELPKGAAEPEGEPQLQASGGPDTFGYKWIDSDQPGGPAFSWVEIRTIGTPIPFTGDDQNMGWYNIGFTFPFYGTNFTQFRACTNGWISFTDATKTSYTNTTLPNTGTGTPRNLLAPFWDDLTFASNYGDAFYYYDGSRLIIEFWDARKVSYTTSTSFTFEVIIYPSGKIVYQYLTMTGAASTLTSATIGQQNADATIGLQIVYNAAYIHNNLAIMTSVIPEWLKIVPASGTVPAHGTAVLSAIFNATDLYGGDYLGAVHLDTNDPNVPRFDIPAQLHVTGVPDIAAVPASLDFGTVFLGYTKLIQMEVVNEGTDVLNVHDIVPGSTEYTVDQTAFSLPPMGRQMVNVVFTPTATGDRSSTLTVMSNDPDEGTLVIPLAGQCILEPDIAVAPTSLHEDLLEGETATETVRIDNTGGSNLDYLIAVSLMGQAVQHEYVEYGKDQVISGNGDPQVEGRGGPDVFGYRWSDSDEPGGPVYDWVEISTIGTSTNLNGDDQNLGPFPIGFSFPFYGTTFSTFRACSNGWISFTSTANSLSNSALPSTGAPFDLVAPFWDDLNMSVTGHAYYYYDGTRTIIEYKDVPHYSSTGTGTYTFEIMLYPSGKIVYQYQSVVGTLNSCTVGIQNATGTDGLQAVYNADYLHDSMAIQFAFMPEWLSCTPSTGTIPAGGFVDLTVGFDANDMFGGDYTGSLQIRSNDPDEGLVLVECTLHVTGMPDIDVAPLALDYGPIYIGRDRTLPVTVTNAGTDQLDVTGISCDNPEFGTAEVPFSLGPLASRVVEVTFAPANAGPRTGTLSFFSNDADEPEVQVALAGEGVVPPEIAVDPDALRATAAVGGLVKTKTLTVMNHGGSDLTWDAGAFQVISGVPQGTYLDLPKGEKDPRPGQPAIMGKGGPDVFGYTWIDSDEPGGPTYSWVDISGVGTPIFGAYYDDRNNGPFNIGFNFPFYGSTFSQFQVCTNGWLSFTSTLTAYTNQPLPNSAATVPENMLAVFWDDLVNDPVYGNEVYYYNDGTRLIVQYEVRYLGQTTAPFFSFEIVLYPDGTIVYQYRTLGPTTNSATIGIQDAAKTDGLQVVFNAAYAHSNLAIQFAARPQWLSVTPTSGVIPAGGSQDLRVVFDPRELERGYYEGVINIASNDLETPLVGVPAYFTVSNVIALTYLDTDFNAAPPSDGRWVNCTVGLPAGYNPALVDVSSVALATSEGAVAADPESYAYTGPDNAGAYQLHFRFDRRSVQAIVPEGNAVAIQVSGEIAGAGYFSGSQTVCVTKPVLAYPNGGETLQSGNPLTVTWGLSEGRQAESYSLYFSPDNATSWQEVAAGITGHSVTLPVPAVETTTGLFRVYAFAEGVPVGYDESEQPFTICNSGAGVPGGFVPTEFALKQNMPNPFDGSTFVVFDVSKLCDVRVDVYDINGRLVKTLVDEAMTAARYNIGWDGRDARGHQVTAGVYFLKMEAGSFAETKRMVVAK